MKRVTGIGGIFFKAKDPKALGEWYRTHLGIDVLEWGGAAFQWNSDDNPSGRSTTIWSPFAADTTHFGPSGASFMINYRVADLDAVLDALRSEGCAVDDKPQSLRSALEIDRRGRGSHQGGRGVRVVAAIALVVECANAVHIGRPGDETVVDVQVGRRRRQLRERRATAAGATLDLVAVRRRLSARRRRPREPDR